MLIRDLMTTPAVTVLSETPVSEALRLLDQNKITSVPVVDRNGALIGLLSEADLMQDALLLSDRLPSAPITVSAASRRRRVVDVMAHLVMSVHPDDELDDAIDLMRSTMVKSLPVEEAGRVVGVVSRSDIIHLLATREDRISADVNQALSQRNPSWHAEVDGGVVKVTGPATDHDRRQARAVADSVRGVVAVHIA
ncbi:MULTISPECIES: CBS domain-containing protein [unclassified Kribbella]|uniref:CBS domain-containing protein n=1 Tax=unclassified Kribbella TaxID=2644121 RepID=UPI0033E6A98A